MWVEPDHPKLIYVLWERPRKYVQWMNGCTNFVQCLILTHTSVHYSWCFGIFFFIYFLFFIFLSLFFVSPLFYQCWSFTWKQPKIRAFFLRTPRLHGVTYYWIFGKRFYFFFPHAGMWILQRSCQTIPRYLQFKLHLKVSLVSPGALIREWLVQLLQLRRK